GRSSRGLEILDPIADSPGLFDYIGTRQKIDFPIRSDAILAVAADIGQGLERLERARLEREACRGNRDSSVLAEIQAEAAPDLRARQNEIVDQRARHGPHVSRPGECDRPLGHGLTRYRHIL